MEAKSLREMNEHWEYLQFTMAKFWNYDDYRIVWSDIQTLADGILMEICEHPDYCEPCHFGDRSLERNPNCEYCGPKVMFQPNPAMLALNGQV